MWREEEAVRVWREGGSEGVEGRGGSRCGGKRRQ